MGTYVTKYAKKNNLKIVDSKSQLRLEIRPDDVVKATQKNSKCCAFACAAKRVPKVKAAYFFRSTAWLEYADRLVRYNLPPSVQKEIVSFDRSKVVATGTYTIVPFSKASKLHANVKRNATKPKRKIQATKSKTKKRFVHRTQLVRTLFEPANA